MARADREHRFLPFEETPTPIEEGRVHVIGYGPDGFEEARGDGFAEVQAVVEDHPRAWVNVTGTGDHELLRELADALGLHPLVVEDIENTRQQPKVEEYEDLLYVVTRMATLSEGGVDTEQMSMILREDLIITVQETPGDPFEDVRERLRRTGGRLRDGPPDRLLHALLDVVVDGYFPLLESFGERVDDLEERILAGEDTDVLEEVHDLKRELTLLRRLLWPQRTALATLERVAPGPISEDTRPYIRDVHDHAQGILDTVDVYRELGAAVRDLYLNQVSQRTNDIMRLLTVVASIFIPLTFLAGIWGMNFENMPELAVPWAYPAVLAAMVAIAFGQVVYFRRQGWI